MSRPRMKLTDDGYEMTLPRWFVYSMSGLTIAIFASNMFMIPVMLHASNVCDRVDSENNTPHTHTVPSVPQPQPQSSETGRDH